MRNDSDVEHRTRHTAAPSATRVEEVAAEGGERELFEIRMPITSTGEARDGDAFSRDRLDGFREQIEAGGIGVFLDHGRNEGTGSRYSALGKLGRIANPSIETRDGTAELDVDMRFPLPGAVPESAPTLREALATIRTQAEAGIPLTSSVGWAEDTGERDVPGDADLLEVSIVGIPSDPRTTTASAGVAAARAASAASSGLDVDQFVAEFRDAITADDLKPATPVHVDGESADTTRAEFEVGDETIDLTPPDRVANAASLGLAKKDEFEDDLGDCGTGVGEDMAQAILDDGLTPEIVANGGDIASNSPATYLDSHESDLDADGPPTSWSEEDWTGGCAEVQQALWGFYVDWFEEKEAAVEEAMAEADGENGRRIRVEVPDDYSHDEMLAAKEQAEEMGVDGGAIHAHGEGDSRTYMAGANHASIVAHLRETGEIDMPTNDNRNLDDPEFAEGDAVMWSSQDTPVHGRVAGVHEQYSPNEDVTITGDDGEAVYSIYEWDDSLSPPAFQNSPSDPNIAKPQSSLSESGKDMPPASEENFAGENSMSDDTENERDEPNLRTMYEEMQEVREMMEENTEMCREMHEEMMGGHGGDEGEEENAADAADADDERTVTLDGEEMPADEAHEELRALREEAAEADPADSQTTERAADETDDDAETTADFW